MCKVLLICLLFSWSQPTLIRGAHNMTLVRSVLSIIASREDWSNTPIFVGHNVNTDAIRGLISWLHRPMEVTSHTVDLSTPARKQKPLGQYNMNADKSISLLFCHSSQDPIWNTLDKSLQKMRRVRLIVALRSKRSGSNKAMQSIFQKLWHLQFLNVLVLHRDRIFSYTPYPAVRFFPLNITSIPLFPPTTSNFQGYVVSTPVENDIPRVFVVQDPHTGRRQIRGYAYRTFLEYLHRHNATLLITNPHENHGPTSSVNMKRIVQLIMEGHLEISAHPYIRSVIELGDRSYPLIVTQNCLIVPVRNEIPRHMYLLLPLDRWSWLVLLGGVFYISVVLYWTLPNIGRRTWQHRLGLSFLDAISRLLYITPPVRIDNPSLRCLIVFLQLSILGFMLSNWYNLQLDSFLTALVVGEQVDSWEQLIEQQQRVLVKEYEVDTVLRHVQPRLVSRVARLIVGVNASEQVTALLSFNRSYAYPFTTERWDFIEMQQQYAFKPIFRFSSACLGSPIIGFPMRSDCHLEATLSIFIMRIQAAGLLKHWLVSDFNDAMRAGYVRLLDNVLAFKALDVDTLRLGWCVLGFGWLLSALAFTCEHLRLYRPHPDII